MIMPFLPVLLNIPPDSIWVHTTVLIDCDYKLSNVFSQIHNPVTFNLSYNNVATNYDINNFILVF